MARGKIQGDTAVTARSPEGGGRFDSAARRSTNSATAAAAAERARGANLTYESDPSIVDNRFKSLGKIGIDEPSMKNRQSQISIDLNR